MNVDTALPKEISRCRELLVEYERMVAAIEVDLDYAVKAIASGDVIKMMKAYTNLKKCK